MGAVAQTGRAGLISCVGGSNPSRPIGGIKMKPVEKIANSITTLGAAANRDAAGGNVGCLTEAVMGVTAGLMAVAESINNVAEAINNTKQLPNPQLLLSVLHDFAAGIDALDK